MLQDFTVVISVYDSDNAAHFKLAMNSILEQTYPPKTIILVVDGAINASLDRVVKKFKENPIINVERLPKNIGLGASRDYAIQLAKTSLIAVMDSDDICSSRRFEYQVNAIKTFDVDIVGGYISEFKELPELIDKVRKVSVNHEDILKQGKFISPMNHVTIMFKRKSYMKAGGYHPLKKIEDYDLFHRMIISGLKFHNISKILVYVRVTNDQYKRRHGLPYLREEINLHYRMYCLHYINLYEFIRNILVRVPMRLLPVFILRNISKKYLRVFISIKNKV